MQCPTCGHRYREPRCPKHGAQQGYVDATPDLAQWPIFPGYRVVKVLGQGGFGTVYAAEGTAGAVAIKTAHRSQPLADARLRREAAALRTIGPPFVPLLHDEAVLEDGTAYLVMDLIAWPTLADRLCDRPPLSVAETLPVARGILEALAAAHARGLVHRDLKPENIFVSDQGEAKLVDFGLVRKVGPKTGENLTAAGSIIGSSAYMSPEQATGRDNIDGRADVYAVGVILYEMLAGPRSWGRPPRSCRRTPRAGRRA